MDVRLKESQVSTNRNKRFDHIVVLFFRVRFKNTLFIQSGSAHIIILSYLIIPCIQIIRLRNTGIETGVVPTYSMQKYNSGFTAAVLTQYSLFVCSKVLLCHRGH